MTNTEERQNEPGGISCSLDSDTDVGLLESRSVVGTVSSHGHELSSALQVLDDSKFVLGNDLCEAVGPFDLFNDGELVFVFVDLVHAGVEDVAEHSETLGDFDCNDLLVACE